MTQLDHTISLCAKLGQWQQISQMTGMSEAVARSTFDSDIKARKKTEPVKDTGKPISAHCASTPMRKAKAPPRKAEHVNPLSPSEMWSFRNRIKLLGFNLRQFSRTLGLGESTVSNNLSPSGYCSEEFRARMETMLTHLEAQVRA